MPYVKFVNNMGCKIYEPDDKTREDGLYPPKNRWQESIDRSKRTQIPCSLN